MRGDCDEPVVACPAVAFFFLLGLNGTDQSRPHDTAWDDGLVHQDQDIERIAVLA
jgi:hypothetical protein